MILLGWLAFGLLVCFGGVLLFGAPYLPTLKPQIEQAIDMADLKPGQTLLELGCGDGRVMLAAAKRGVNVIGYELNPLMAVIAWLRTLRYRKHAKIIWGDFWRAEWPDCQAVFTFLLPRYMQKLDKKVMQSTSRPVKLVSFAFAINGKKPVKYHDGLYLYLYK